MTSYSTKGSIQEGMYEKAEIDIAHLAYYEALDAIVEEIIRPMSEHGYIDAEMERENRFAFTWSDEEVKEAMRGSAIWDDPPDGWDEAHLLLYSRGYLVGRAIVGGNLGQHFSRFVKAVKDPVRYWRRWRLGFLDMCKFAPCPVASCSGRCEIEEEQIGLVCQSCGTFYSYEQIRRSVVSSLKRRGDHQGQRVEE